MTWPLIDSAKSVISSIKTMVNGDIIFQITDHIHLVNLFSECITANNATASTLQYQVVPDVGAPGTISGVSASLASAIAGSVIVIDGASLSAAPPVSSSGIVLAPAARGIILPPGTIRLVVGVGSTTGTWLHSLHYYTLHPGASASGV
jgi:hypothetical protein